MAERGARVESVSDPRVAASVVRILRARSGELSSSRPRHACSNARCRPLNEEALIGAGRLEAFVVAANVYVCTLGATHVCSESECDLYAGSGNGTTCPVSGAQYQSETSSYSRSDARTWNEAPASKAKAKKRPRAEPPPHAERGKSGSNRLTVAKKMKAMSEETVKRMSGDIVTRLLFGVERVRRNDAEIEQHRVRAEKRCDKYRRSMLAQRQRPYESVLECIAAECARQPLPLREYEFSDALYNYYTDIVHQVWTQIIRYLGEDAAAKTVRHCDPETVCVSTLYSMRDGLTQTGRMMLPADPFLRDNLPAVGDLATYFGIERSRLSQGSHVLTAALKYSLQTYGQAALRADLMAIATADDVRAFEHAKEHARVPIKMSSSGETLFMPQSRKKRA